MNNAAEEILPENTLPFKPEVVQPSNIIPFTTYSVDEVLAYEEPPGQHLLLPSYVTKGELTLVIGQGGIGKSRLAGFWLPICQITGKPWCGLETGGDPQHWLYIGNENSLARQKADLSKIMGNLGERQQALVREFFHVHVMTTFEDRDIMLTPDTSAKLGATLEVRNYGGVVFDPFVNMVVGDINKPAEVKEAIRTLNSVCGKHAPDATMILLHHSRTGRMNVQQGLGLYDGPNFALGAKAVYSSARCVINLMPGDEHDASKLVMACGKSNNGPQFKTRGLLFDEDTFTYSVDPSFDMADWQASVAGKGKRQLCDIKDIVAAVKDGKHKTKDILNALHDTASEPTINRMIKEAVHKEAIIKAGHGQYALGPKAELYHTELRFKSGL